MVSVNAGAAWAKGLFPAVGSEGVTALRVGLAALILLAIVRPWRFGRPARADVGNLLVYGLMLGAMNLCIYRAFERIPLGIAVAIEVTGPLAVVVLSSRHARDFVWAVCAGFGLWLLLPVAGATQLDPAGIAYALAAAFCWAMYIVFGKRVSTLNSGQAVAWGLLALFTPAMLAGGVAVALLSSALPYSLEMMALRRLPQRVFGILVSSGPAIAALAGFIWLGERLTSLQWLAIVLVIVASGGAAATAGKPRV